ncbi:MFS transporter [Chloroflexota bacterium]
MADSYYHFFASAFSGAVIYYGFTAYFDPLVNEFGWSYTAISLAASFRSAELGMMDIVVGFLIDRFGSRRIIFTGSVLIGIGFLLLSRIDSLAAFYVSYLIICIGASGISSTVFYSAISRWFRKRLGIALGLAAAGFGAGGFGVPVIVYLLDLVGFRMVFVIIGIAAFILSLCAPGGRYG